MALVTGASGGIGTAIALNLAATGVDLFLVYGQHGEHTENVAAQARTRGRRALAASADPSAPARLVKQANDEFGAVDILIANAGTATIAAWDEVDLQLWNSTLAINLTAPFLLAQQLLPGMVERRFGRVLFVSSAAGLNGGVVGAHYAASKAGLHGLTHHLAPRVAADGVTVNALAPALIGDTRMFPGDPAGAATPVHIPVGRAGQSEEVADMAIAMLRNGYLTNKVIALDGGILPR